MKNSMPGKPMAIPNQTLWPADPHTLAKHSILRGYLSAWFPIIASWSERVIYVDGFCGPGEYQGGEPGSPIIALDVALNHRTRLKSELLFLFIDERHDRIEHLRSTLEGRTLPPNFKVRVAGERFESVLGPILDQLDQSKKRLAPAFCFIDPFGFSGAPFAFIRRLLSFPSCEVFITFMVDSISRFLEHPNPAIRGHMLELFGTEEAFAIAQQRGVDRILALRNLYQRQLGTHAKFVRYFELRDSRDRVQYYLFFASNHRLGHLRMKESMWAVDEAGDFRFSDATDAGQPILLSADPSPVLSNRLAKVLAGRELDAAQVIEAVEDQTGFLTKHARAALRYAEEHGQITVAAEKRDGTRRRRGTFPNGTIVKWNMAGQE